MRPLVWAVKTAHTPDQILFGRPDIGTAAAESKSRQAHRLEGTVTREDQQICPRDLLTVLVLDRPQQPARLVEVDVVGPTVEWGEALCAGPPPPLPSAMRYVRAACHVILMKNGP